LKKREQFGLRPVSSSDKSYEQLRRLEKELREAERSEIMYSSMFPPCPALVDQCRARVEKARADIEELNLELYGEVEAAVTPAVGQTE
jgi:hypothetical protein